MIKTAYVIDDEKFDRILYKRVIKKSGFVENLHMYAGAEEALCAFHTALDRPELIFLDINMPRMNGFDFLQQADDMFCASVSGVSVAMLTTSQDPRDRDHAFGFKSVRWFLNKPLTEDSLKHIKQGMSKDSSACS